MDFTGFGFTNGEEELTLDFFSAGQDQEKKKSEKKKEKNKEKNEKKSDFMINLPVEVIGRNFTVTLEGSSTIGAREALEKIVELGFHEVSIQGKGLAYDEGSRKLYVCGTAVDESSDTLVDLSEDRIIKVVDGLLVAEYNISHFPGYEGDEISVDMLKKAFIDSNPLYSGCQLAYDHEQGLAYPVLQKAEKLSFPLNVYYKGELIVINHEKSDKDILKEICGELKQVIPYLSQLHNGITIEYSCNYKKNFVTSLKRSAALTTKKQKVEEKYLLPLNLFVSTFGYSTVLTTDHFPQKTKVTINDIKKKLGEDIAIFRDSKRELDVLYLAEQHKICFAFTSGKKGAHSNKGKPIIQMVESKNEYEERLASDNFIGVYCDESKGEDIKMLCLPHGNFLGVYGEGLECGTIKKVIFQRKLPLIAKAILDEVLDYFRSLPDKEAVVRIIYNKERRKYFVRRSKGDGQKCHIAYFFDDTSMTLNSNMVCAMEIHSHNKMPAFFSKIDDADEVYPGVFGVIGNIDKIRASILFRAGLDGVYTMVPINELFNMERKV